MEVYKVLWSSGIGAAWLVLGDASITFGVVDLSWLVSGDLNKILWHEKLGGFPPKQS